MLAAPIEGDGVAGGGGGGGGRSGTESSAAQQAQAMLGIPRPLCYGRVRARGNLLGLNEAAADKYRAAFIGLAEGEWDGIDRFWINGALVNPVDPLVHFHSGLDGTLGNGLAAVSTGGDQHVDYDYNYFSAAMQKQTFSRLAYLALYVPPDPAAPSATLDWVGDFRTTKVRIFDAAGNQTAYQFSTNPAWIALDLLLRTVLMRESLLNAALPAAVKARINFAAFKDTADYNDEVLAGGQKRWECSVAWPTRQDLKTRLQQLGMISRSYIVEAAGVVSLYSDKARASTFILTSDMVRPGTFKAPKSQLRGTSNRLQGKYNDLLTSIGATVDTIANSGAMRTANVATLKTTVAHGFKANDAIIPQGVSDASFCVAAKIASVPTTTSLTYANPGANVGAATAGGGIIGTPESIFTPRTKVVDHENHQLAVGQRGVGLTPMQKRNPVDLDFGNCTGEQAERAMHFLAVRNLGPDAAPYQAPQEIEAEAWAESVDANDHALIAQLCGDIITVDKSVSEEFQGDYEITHATFAPASQQSSPGGAGGQAPGSIALKLLQCESGAFTDVADGTPAIAATVPAKALAPITQVNAAGKQVLGISTPLNPQGSVNPQVIEASCTFVGVWPTAGNVGIRVAVNAGNIYLPDGTAIAVPAAGPTDYANWAGAAVAGSTNYCGNGVWDLAAGAFARQEYNGWSTKATKKDAFADGKIAINFGIDITTPAAAGGSGGGGGGSGCFSGNVGVSGERGRMTYREIERAGGRAIVMTAFGPMPGKLIVHPRELRFMIDMGEGELVTSDHLFWSKHLRRAIQARRRFSHTALVPFWGKVYNFELDARRPWERWYYLWRGDIVSNLKSE